MDKIFDFFGYIPKSKLEKCISDYGETIRKITNEKLVLKAEVAAMKKDEELERNTFNFHVGDPTPTETELRKMYVASVSGFFKDTLKKKLEYMIFVAHKLLEEQTNDRDLDLNLKGVVYAFRELLKWGESMVNEQIAYQTDNNSEPKSLTQSEKQSLQDVLN